MLGGAPSTLDPPATTLLYSGEQFDVDLQQQYLRSRYYDQENGRFNRLTPLRAIERTRRACITISIRMPTRSIGSIRRAN